MLTSENLLKKWIELGTELSDLRLSEKKESDWHYTAVIETGNSSLSRY